MTVEEIADIVFGCVGVNHGFIQPCYELCPREGRVVQYRVVLHSTSKMGSITSADLLEAIEDALDRIGIPMPPQLAELRTRENCVAAGIAEVNRERRFHHGYIPSIAFLAERLRIGTPAAGKILAEVVEKTTPRKKEKQ